MSTPRLTLGQVFAIALATQAVVLGALFWLVYADSRDALTRSAGEAHLAASDRVAGVVQAGLAQAEDAVLELEKQLRFEAARVEDLSSVEASLFGSLIHRDKLVEISFTYARGMGYERRGQLTVLRVYENPGERFVTRHLSRAVGRWTTELRDRPLGGTFADTPFAPAAGPDGSDPTEHATYITPAAERWRGMALWSDLHFYSLDEALPPERKRKVVSVQKAIYGGHGELLGVARAAVLGDTLDKIGRPDPGDPRRMFICDRLGRLITRLGPGDRYDTVNVDGKPDPDGDVRVIPAALPPDVAVALTDPDLGSLEPDRPILRHITAGGQAHLVSLKPLLPERSQDWVVGVVVPEKQYLGRLTAARDQLLGGSAGLMAIILVGGVLLVRSVRRGLRRVVSETERMRRFEFAPGGERSPFRDVNAALDSLERAKTALRALGKYVPVELVRKLYHAQQEPELGGELQDLTISFSDIEGFTTVAEEMTPDELAQSLGRYLDAMTRVIQDHGGTIDKYVGDAVMALWNAPAPLPRHALAACRAAVACLEATAGMFPSRIGIHRDTVMVGHFGAPSRLSFTAIGDGVNLAARLEGLNKLYGTRILVSETVAGEAREEFVVRLIDRVAVRGKNRPIDVYELCGRAETVGEARRGALARYEAAFEAYLAGRFAEAAETLARNGDDAPSRVLAARCARLAAAPPPGWDGVYAAVDK